MITRRRRFSVGVSSPVWRVHSFGSTREPATPAPPPGQMRVRLGDPPLDLSENRRAATPSSASEVARYICAHEPRPGDLRVEHDQRGHVVAPVADRARLADQRMTLQLVLDEGRRDVLPAGGDDQLLLPVGDLQEAVGVELADVAGVHPPAVVQRFRPRPLGVLVVAAHHQRPANQDLAVVGDPHFHARERLADRAVARDWPGAARVAALDSSLIPQPSMMGSPSAWKNSMIAGSIGAAPLPAMRHWSRPIWVSIACRTAAGMAPTGGWRDASGRAARSAAYSFSHTRGMLDQPGRVDLRRDLEEPERVRAVREGERAGHRPPSGPGCAR